MRVNVVCRNWRDDRVLPRFARYLADGLGWTLTPRPVPGHDVTYLMGYFEKQVCPQWPMPGPTASLFTHREEAPELLAKTALYDRIAGDVDLRVAMCRLYGAALEHIGPTVQPPLPVERDRFTITRVRHHARPVVGLSGFSAPGGRKGYDVAERVVRSGIGRRVDWVASGRGWAPLGIRSHSYAWRDMPTFYQGLDVLVCPSRVEGGPMPVLEALSCGVRVVIPRGVGILDELPDVPGLFRYVRGDVGALAAALKTAISTQVEREALRAVTEPYTVKAWCAGHAAGFAQLAAAA